MDIQESDPSQYAVYRLYNAKCKNATYKCKRPNAADPSVRVMFIEFRKNDPPILVRGANIKK